MPIRIMEVPAGHPYTRAVTDADWDGIEILPDPVPNPDKWWPHPAVDAQWWREHPRAADVCHIHFGFEHRTPDQIADLVRVLSDQGVGLVVTVHDLDNPHLVDQTDHHRRLRILLAAADRVITLTNAAAAVIRRDYGATAEVLPHPPIVTPARENHGEGACVFLKSVRANTVQDPQFYRGTGLTVYAHRDAADHPLVRALSGDVILHDPLADADLYRTLSRHRVALLPYSRGTHSGWLEMCRDLGMNVVAPDCGCYASQADRPGVVFSYETGTNPREVIDKALQAPVRRRATGWDTVTDRVRTAHRRIYREVAAK